MDVLSLAPGAGLPSPGVRPPAPDALAERAGAACRPLPGAQRQPRKQRRRRERPGRCAHGVARVSEALRLRRGRLLGEGRAEPCVSATQRPLCFSLGQTPGDPVPSGACPRPVASPADLGRSWPGQGLPAGSPLGPARPAAAQDPRAREMEPGSEQ